ncbi:hypothetical protein HNR64_003448, partial [Spongiibacter marinus]|nr:hypothetical protein [Spongiibacter marinus]
RLLVVLVDYYQPITRLFLQPTHLNLRRTKKKRGLSRANLVRLEDEQVQLTLPIPQ